MKTQVTGQMTHYQRASRDPESSPIRITRIRRRKRWTEGCSSSTEQSTRDENYPDPSTGPPTDSTNSCSRNWSQSMRKSQESEKFEKSEKSEKFVVELSEIVTAILRRKKYDNYKNELEDLLKKMEELGIIETRHDFHGFVYDYLPKKFGALCLFRSPGIRLIFRLNRRRLWSRFWGRWRVACIY